MIFPIFFLFVSLLTALLLTILPQHSQFTCKKVNVSLFIGEIE